MAHPTRTRPRTHAERAGFAAADLAFIDDLIIENNQCYKQAEIYSTVFAGLTDARGNLVNHNMNTLLKNLTLINVIFLPLNLLASIGGMSEFSMMTRGVDWRIAYALSSSPCSSSPGPPPRSCGASTSGAGPRCNPPAARPAASRRGASAAAGRRRRGGEVDAGRGRQRPRPWFCALPSGSTARR